MEDKLRERLRLNLLIKLTMLPRWVKHDFWRQSQPQNDTARAKMVEELITVIDETVDVAEKENTLPGMVMFGGAELPGSGRTIKLSKQEAALRQIHAAIEHLWKEEFDSSITLAGAAEEQINFNGPDTLRERILAKVPLEERKELGDTLNEHRNWLKHTTTDLPPEIEIGEFEAVIMLVRAITKFNGRYNQTSSLIADFARWCVKEKYFDPDAGKRARASEA